MYLLVTRIVCTGYNVIFQCIIYLFTLRNVNVIKSDYDILGEVIFDDVKCFYVFICR